MCKALLYKETLQKLIDEGMLKKDIAVELNVSPTTITTYLKKCGIKMKKGRPKKYNKKAIVECIEKGMTNEEIAKEFETTVKTVEYWIYNNNLNRKKERKIDLCKKCVYREKAGREGKCDYIGKTGHSKFFGQHEDVCSKFVDETKLKLKRRKFRSVSPRKE